MEVRVQLTQEIQAEVLLILEMETKVQYTPEMSVKVPQDLEILLLIDLRIAADLLTPALLAEPLFSLGKAANLLGRRTRLHPIPAVGVHDPRRAAAVRGL